MSKLIHVKNSEVARFQGYLNAAQHIFLNGDMNVTLEAALFEIVDHTVSDEDVVDAVYPDSNPIESRKELTVEEMVTNVNTLMTIPRYWWKPGYSMADLIEENIREGFWKNLGGCFDYENTKVVELGDNIPWVEMGDGFTYVLYAPDMSRCMLLVGNVSD